MDDQGTAQLAPTGTSAWTSTSRNLLLIAAVVFALLGLLALATAIDLPTRDSASNDNDSDQEAVGTLPGGLELGPDGDVSIRPMPNCPGGFSIGDRIFVVPDPEACGLILTDPGEQGFGPDDIIILSPGTGSGSENGIGRIRINPDGTVELLPPGPVGPNDLTFGWSEDDVFGLIRPDGSRIEIIPQDDGISLRDPSRGGSSFIPSDDGNASGSDGQGSDGALGPDDTQSPDDAQAPDGGQSEPLDVPPSLVEPDANEPAENSDSADDSDGSSIDWSFLGPLLLAVAALCFVGFLILTIRNREQQPEEDAEPTPEPVIRADYAAEISALDRLLWEIDQERDPRLAIQRVYAALETGLDNPQMARKLSETPGIYLRRILGHFTVLEGPLQELTDLFEQARFSEHEITVGMRERAVMALVSVREHYAHAAQTTVTPPPVAPAGFGAV